MIVQSLCNCKENGNIFVNKIRKKLCRPVMCYHVYWYFGHHNSQTTLSSRVGYGNEATSSTHSSIENYELRIIALL